MPRRSRAAWPKKKGWHVKAFDSGTQYRARVEGAGKRRGLVLYRRPPNGRLEQVTTVAEGDWDSLEHAALVDDVRRVAQNLTRCSKATAAQETRALEARAACDLVRDDLARVGHLVSRQEREDLSRGDAAIASVLGHSRRAGRGR